jgi:hypothetical protein
MQLSRIRLIEMDDRKMPIGDPRLWNTNCFLSGEQLETNREVFTEDYILPNGNRFHLFEQSLCVRNAHKLRIRRIHSFVRTARREFITEPENVLDAENQ